MTQHQRLVPQEKTTEHITLEKGVHAPSIINKGRLRTIGTGKWQPALRPSMK
jgi:hypothetical protein